MVSTLINPQLTQLRASSLVVTGVRALGQVRVA